MLYAIPGQAAAGLTCGGLAATIVGTDGPDEIHGTDGPDVIVGLGGKDVIYGHKGKDVICGGGNADVIRGGKGADVIFGQGGHDVARGNGNDDTIYGGAGNDRIFGNLGSDVARGKRGADVCVAEDEANCEMDYRGPRPAADWLDLVEIYFGPLGITDEALSVLGCESNGDPFALNPVSGASGLFQFLPSTWDRWNPRTPGWEGESMFHPEANIATARRLVDASLDEGQDTWWQWSCEP